MTQALSVIQIGGSTGGYEEYVMHTMAAKAENCSVFADFSGGFKLGTSTEVDRKEFLRRVNESAKLETKF